ncbi:uncharacterized protein CEXT_710311 [Caerostris extrusa]|uniref:Uncharacterized protein n=1 Tax=Caerostris extrusa TaxID=172846 RepID=A0AAV4S7T3_CAEEX|nr:uncharacterized protein CEXT_710311 [Caerostris extrusa]
MGPHSSHSRYNFDHSNKGTLDIEDFNALDDTKGMVPNNAITDDDEESNNNFQIGDKKSMDKPKYNPGWKFIGLGKRPHQKEYFNDYPTDQENSYYNNYPNDLDYSLADNTDPNVDPLLTFSTLINFEIVNALRDGIAEITRKTMKKGEGKSSSYAGGNYGSNVFSNQLNIHGGRRKNKYDPGWMLTGLGKRSS